MSRSVRFSQIFSVTLKLIFKTWLNFSFQTTDTLANRLHCAASPRLHRHTVGTPLIHPTTCWGDTAFSLTLKWELQVVLLTLLELVYSVSLWNVYCMIHLYLGLTVDSEMLDWHWNHRLFNDTHCYYNMTKLYREKQSLCSDCCRWMEELLDRGVCYVTLPFQKNGPWALNEAHTWLNMGVCHRYCCYCYYTTAAATAITAAENEMYAVWSVIKNLFHALLQFRIDSILWI